MDEVSFASISELHELLTRRRVSSRELTQHALQRLGSYGHWLNAVAAVTRDRALDEAARADKRIAQGATNPLVGIPYGAKDLLAATGAPTTYGSAAFKDQRLDFDAAAVERLHSVGAVLAAKLSMAELAGIHARHPASSLQGPIRNPWQPERWAGGSSGGSGAAVAAGILPFAIGSETAGSIGSPSAWCGVTGLRPTFGLVSRFGAMPLAWSLDKIGPIARSARDCGLVLEALAGYDRRDASSSRKHYRFEESDAIRLAALREFRIGFAESDIEQVAPPEARPQLRLALGALHDLHIPLIPASLPPEFPYRETLDTIMSGEASSALGALIDSDRLKLIGNVRQRSALRSTLKISARSYLDATRHRGRLQRDLRALFRKVDFLVSYNFARPWPIPALDREFEPVPIEGGNTALVWAGNLAGLPALFLPAGLVDGMPIGIQLVGRPFSERDLIAVGMAFQTATSWHRLRPPLNKLRKHQPLTVPVVRTIE